MSGPPEEPKNPVRVLGGVGGLAFMALYTLSVPGIAAGLGAWSAPEGWSRPGFAWLAAVSAVAWAAAGIGIYTGVSRIAGDARPAWSSGAGKVYLFLTSAAVIVANVLQRPVERNLALVCLGTSVGWALLIGFVAPKVFGTTSSPMKP